MFTRKRHTGKMQYCVVIHISKKFKGILINKNNHKANNYWLIVK